MDIVGVLSLKGGVGKTQITVMTAQGLREMGKRVGILDLDIHGPTTPYALGLDETPPLGLDTVGECIVPPMVDGIPMVSMASHFGEGYRILWKEMDRVQLTQELLGGVIKWGDLDYLIVDTPPNQGEPVLVLLQDKRLKGVILVTQPTTFSWKDSERMIDLFREYETPIFGVISNMDGVVCEKCGEVSYPWASKRVEVQKFCQEKGVPFLFSIPLTKDLSIYKRKLAEVVTTYPTTKLPSGKMLKKITRQTVKKVIQKILE